MEPSMGIVGKINTYSKCPRICTECNSGFALLRLDYHPSGFPSCIFQDSLIIYGAGAIARLYQCQWSNQAGASVTNAKKLLAKSF